MEKKLIRSNSTVATIVSVYEDLIILDQDHSSDDMDDIPDGMELVYNTPTSHPLSLPNSRSPSQSISRPVSQPFSPPASSVMSEDSSLRQNIAARNSSSTSPVDEVPSRSPPKPVAVSPPSLPPRTDKPPASPLDKPPVPSRGGTLSRPPPRPPSETLSSKNSRGSVAAPPPSRPVPELPPHSATLRSPPTPLLNETTDSDMRASLSAGGVSLSVSTERGNEQLENEYVIPGHSPNLSYRSDSKALPPQLPSTAARFQGTASSQRSISAGLSMSGAAASVIGVKPAEQKPKTPPRLPRRAETMAVRQVR